MAALLSTIPRVLRQKNHKSIGTKYGHHQGAVLQGIALLQQRGKDYRTNRAVAAVALAPGPRKRLRTTRILFQCFPNFREARWPATMARMTRQRTPRCQD